ncbi:MAG: trypsin-like peptidase domain-containing protein [Leptolyngbyaceae cyanobacterium T60_A2020_046]|nr:trypsin-like peptidase domain-containing protein [Leptolyngbyaceae cyanobacterium T60_A2020_046]
MILDRLEDLLAQCTVELMIADGTCGTGFLVAPGWVLTCEHGVRSAGEGPIQIRWQTELHFATATVARTVPSQDLALLTFAPPREDLPCVWLDDDVQRQDDLYLFGYPDRDYPDGRPASFICEGNFTENGLSLMLLKQGQMQPGMSGAALLNGRTGKVCGMAKLTRDQSTDLGSGGIHGAVIAQHLPEIMVAQRQFHQRDRRWAELEAVFLSPRQSSIPAVALEPDQTRPVLTHWQGREQELADLSAWLAEPTVRLVEIIGVGGFGKSALAAKWLTQVQAVRTEWVNFSLVYSFRVFGMWLLHTLGRPVDDRIDIATLIALLVQQLSAQPTLVVLNNLETLTADAATFADYRQFLMRWLEQGTTSQLVVTSREQPDLPPNLRRQRCRTQSLQGLTPDAAVALLRAQGVQGDEAELADFARLTDGHPLLLNLIVGQLWDTYGEEPPISEWARLNPDLFAYMGAHRGDPETSVGRVFEASYGRLAPEQQALLRHVSVYRPRFDGAMALAMADGVLAADPQFEAHTLRYLVRLALLQEEPPAYPQPRRYFLLPLITRYVQRQGTLTLAHERAVKFYRQVCKPQLTREDGQAAVATYLELAYHSGQLGQYGAAIDLLQRQTNPADPYSSCEMVIALRGDRASLLPLYQSLTAHWQPTTPHDRRRYGNTLRAQGNVLQFLGQSREALDNYDAALRIYREVGDRLGEANTLLGVGALKATVSEQLKLFLAAQEIFIATGDRYSQGRNLVLFIGPAYVALGDVESTRNSFETAAQLGQATGPEALSQSAHEQLKAL